MKVTKFDIFLLVMAGIDFGVGLSFLTECDWYYGISSLALGAFLIWQVLYLAKRMEK